MREIKFRAWDGERMKEVLTWGFNEGFISTPKTLGDENDFDIMQYTGLKDKNGVEIYEGDVVSVGDINYEIVYLAPTFYLRKKANYNINLETFSTPMVFKEVIGNIHENPELIK